LALAEILDRKQLALFLTIGSGKTAIALTAIKMIRPRRTLVLGTLKIVEEVWIPEAQKWDHLQGMDQHMTLLRGSPAQRLALLRGPGRIQLLNYELLPWLMDKVKLNQYYDMIVFDELSKVKAPGTKRFRRMRHQLDGIRYRLGLTGTPAGNSLLDLWSELYSIDGGRSLGDSYTLYRSRYFFPVDADSRSWKPMRGAQALIQEQIKPSCLSLPETPNIKPRVIYNSIPVTMPPSAVATYHKVEKELRAELVNGHAIEALTAGAASNKLRQILAGAAYTEAKVPGRPQRWDRVHPAKLDRLAELVEEQQGEPVLVFVWYRFEVDMIKERIPGAGELDVKRWNAGEQAVAVAHPASAGHGLNLQEGGNTIVFFSLPWSGELFEQACGRLVRPGQRKPYVVINSLVVPGTMDTVVMAALQAKKDVQQAIIDAVRNDRGPRAGAALLLEPTTNGGQTNELPVGTVRPGQCQA